MVDRIQHLKLVGALIEQAAADVGDEGAQVDQTADGLTIGDQRNRMPTDSVPYKHDFVMVRQRGAHYIGVIVKARRAVFTRQVHGYYVMPRTLQEWGQ